MPAFLPLLAGGAAVFTGFKMLGKLFGSDPDFTQAWMMNRMTGQGGFMKTFFSDGMKSMFLGSRTASAAYGSMCSPFGGAMFRSPMMMGGMGQQPMGGNGQANGNMMFGGNANNGM